MKRFFLFAIVLVSYYSFAGEKWEIYKTANGVFLANIRCIEFDANNNLYFTAFDKIFKREANTNEWVIIADNSNPKYFLGNYFNIRGWELSRNGNIIWGASQEGLMKYQIETGELNFIKRKDIMGSGDYGLITGVTVDMNDNVWLASRSPYLTKFDGEKFVDWDVQFANKIIMLPDLDASFASIDTNIFLGGGDGILCWSINSTPGHLIYHKYSLEDLSFTKGGVGIFKDIKGRIWANSGGGEVSYFEDNAWKQLIIPDSLRAPDFNVNGTPTKNSIILFANDSNRIYLFWDNANFFLTIDFAGIITKHSFPESLYYPRIISSKLQKGDLWLGTLDDGLVKYTPSTVGINEAAEGGGLIPDIYIRKIYPNPSDNIVKAELLVYPDNIDQVKIGLYNYMGIKILDLRDRLELNTSTGEAYLTFDITDLPVGAYYLCIEKGNERISKGLLKIIQ